MPSAQVITMNPESIAVAARVVAGGGLVVFPTDTVYGLGCDPFNIESVEKLFAAKSRETKPVPVLCSDYSRADNLVTLGPLSRRLAKSYWPGALTIVGPTRMSVSPRLSQGTGNLGVRVPDHALCVELITACGGYLTGTSANISGEPSAETAQEALLSLGGEVEIILDGGPARGVASTVVQETDAGLTILRSGPVGVPPEMMRRRT